MDTVKVEGGTPAYCPRCREHGHYVTWHGRAPKRRPLSLDISDRWYLR